VPSALSRLSSRQHPIVRAFRQLATRRDQTGDVVLDGAHLIRDALHAHVRLRTVLVSSDFLARAAPADRDIVTIAMRAGALVHEATPGVIAAASPVRTSSGIVAIGEWAPGPLELTFSPAPALVLGLLDVQDPGNVGALIRSADALGSTGIVALDRTADPAGWKALRGAMGSTFRLPVSRASSEAALQAARERGLRIIATVADGAASVAELDLTPPTLVLVGNEGAGLADELIANSDARVTVPMRPGVNSLNVAITAAIILYEARRQRE
jgi:TrmH family RNA methyltransferase